MNTTNARPDHGRAARAATLIAAIDDLLTMTHPARPHLRQLQKLFPIPLRELRELLERVPGKSLQKRADAIGVSKTGLRSMWDGKFVPSAALYERIVAATKKNVPAGTTGVDDDRA